MAAAAAAGSYSKVAIAIVTMVLLVVATNFLVFRPLVAWSERFRMETSEAAEKPKSVVLNFLRRSVIPGLLGRMVRPIGRYLDRITRPFGLAEYPLREDERKRRVGDIIFWVVLGGTAAFVGISAALYLNAHLGFGRFPSIVAQGFATFGASSSSSSSFPLSFGCRWE